MNASLFKVPIRSLEVIVGDGDGTCSTMTFGIMIFLRNPAFTKCGVMGGRMMLLRR